MWYRCRKLVDLFLERLPELEVTDQNGNTKKKIRTKEHCCWFLERLLAQNGRLVTDSAKCYLPMGDWIRYVFYY